MNRGYGVTQFYTVDYSKDGKVIGGSQDNGTQYINFSNNVSSGKVHVDSNAMPSKIFKSLTYRVNVLTNRPPAQ